MSLEYYETQLILAVGAEGFSLQGSPGFIPMGTADAINCLGSSGVWFGPRRVLEETERFRQIIPYVIIQIGQRFVRYTRTPAGGEVRLHGKVSIGLGGHVDLSDVITSDARIDLLGTLDCAAEREVREELGDVDCEWKQWVGLLVDNSTPVSRVHVGFVALWRLRALPNRSAESAIGEVTVNTIAELKGNSKEMEDWSCVLLPHIETYAASGKF